RDASLAAMTGARVNLDFIHEHDVKKRIKKARPKTSPGERSWRLVARRGSFSHNIHAAAVLIKIHFAIDQREQGPTPACSHVLPANKLGAALANQNAAGSDKFPAKSLHAQPFADAITPISDASLTFLMCHTFASSFSCFCSCS